MLFVITTILIQNALSAPTPSLQSCINTVLLSTGKYRSTIALEAERISHGDASLLKHFKTELSKTNPAVYTKHTLAKTEVEAIALSKKGMAQYMTYVDRVSLERKALTEMQGQYVAHGNGFFKFVKFENYIGYSNGLKTQWVRVEWSSGNFHGHPIDLQELRGACPACFKN